MLHGGHSDGECVMPQNAELLSWNRPGPEPSSAVPDLRSASSEQGCQDSMMTERKGTTSQAEDTAPTVTCARHEDSKVPQQGIAVTDPW